MINRDRETRPMPWQWLSFADPHLPPGTQFLGVAIVEADGVIDAALEAHRLRINPGGEVLCAELPGCTPPVRWQNVLLGREEAEAAMAWVDNQVKGNRL